MRLADSRSTDAEAKEKPSTKTRGVHPNSLAALKKHQAPAWTSGTQPKQNGRPPAGLSVIEWQNQLQDATQDELEAIAKDRKAPRSKVAAAIDWLTATSLDRNASGVPINGGGIDRIIDRTAGKAASNNNVHFSGSVNQIVINASVIGRMPPDKLQALYAMIADYLPQEPLTLDDHTNDTSNPPLEVTQAETLTTEQHKAD